MKELRTCGADNLPSIDWDRNSAWLQLAALACSLNAWLRHLALDGQFAKAEPKALRYRLLGAPACLVTHARRKIVKIPPGVPWAGDLATAYQRLQALHPVRTNAPPDQQHHPGRPVNPAPTRAHHRISRARHRNTTVNHPG